MFQQLYSYSINRRNLKRLKVGLKCILMCCWAENFSIQVIASNHRGPGFTWTSNFHALQVWTLLSTSLHPGITLSMAWMRMLKPPSLLHVLCFSLLVRGQDDRTLGVMNHDGRSKLDRAINNSNNRWLTSLVWAWIPKLLVSKPPKSLGGLSVNRKTPRNYAIPEHHSQISKKRSLYQQTRSCGHLFDS